MIYLLAEGGGHGAHIDPMAFGDPANLAATFWALGIFIVLLIVLKKVAWGPIVAGLNAREDRIAESLEKAAAIEKATAELAETNRQALEEAQREAQKILSDARDAGAKAAAEAGAKAQAEIVALKERAQRELQLEARKAQDTLRREAVDLTVTATSKLVGKLLAGDDQLRLVEEALADAEQVARN